jgi:N-methylhydantoinase B
MKILCDEVMVAVRIEGDANPPWGVAGGPLRRLGPLRRQPRPTRRASACAAERWQHPAPWRRRAHRNRRRRGWGHPFDREPERVLADVLGGFVSRASAERDYGVALLASGARIDVEATRERRRARPATKLFHRHEYHESLQ